MIVDKNGWKHSDSHPVTLTGIKGTLPRSWLKLAWEQANTRNKKAHEARARTNLTPVWGRRNLTDWDTNRIGRAAEISVIHAFSLPWDEKDCHWKYDNDVYGVQVRGTDVINGCLSVSEKDLSKFDANKPFIFCPVNYPKFSPSGEWNFNYMVAGWETIGNVASNGRQFEGTGGTLYYMPIRDLMDMDSFDKEEFDVEAKEPVSDADGPGKCLTCGHWNGYMPGQVCGKCWLKDTWPKVRPSPQ